MAFVVDFFRVWITTAFHFLLRVLPVQLCRIIHGDSRQGGNITHVNSILKPVQSLTEPVRVEQLKFNNDKDQKEEETSCIKFPFRFEIPQCNITGVAVPATFTSCNKAKTACSDAGRCSPFHHDECTSFMKETIHEKLSVDEPCIDTSIGRSCNYYRYMCGNASSCTAEKIELQKPAEGCHSEDSNTSREQGLKSQIGSGYSDTISGEISVLSKKDRLMPDFCGHSETLEVNGACTTVFEDEAFLSERDLHMNRAQAEVAVNSMGLNFDLENSTAYSPRQGIQHASAELHGGSHCGQKESSNEEQVDVSVLEKQQSKDKEVIINPGELPSEMSHCVCGHMYPALELKHNHKDSKAKENTRKKDSQHFPETKFRKESDVYKSKERTEPECLWDHQELIEQLRMELKKVRSIGLPTILEESESPKSVEDFKTLKIDTELLDDPLDELYEFYKSYREGMRKLDILNYQKLYAMGFLRFEDPLHFFGTRKATTLSFLHNLWPHHKKKLKTNLPEKFIKELRQDLELVYIGHLCLSWEFLRWQYEKFQEVLDKESAEARPYIHVATEFQHFQVVLQRFLENEPFQGPRIPCYAKNRCVLRNLLQVPVLREDYVKDRVKETRVGRHFVTSEPLEYIMVNSIKLFWEFIKADNIRSPASDRAFTIKGQDGQEDPENLEKMGKLQAELHKKEKKLKDIIKVGNCLIKRLRKPQEERITQDMFFAQVDLKLISRALKMSSITPDQLAWCYKKLSKIHIEDRMLYRDPGFLPFPC